MKRFVFLLVTLISFFPLCAQDVSRVIVMGSSVANGEGADTDSLGNKKGYAYQLENYLKNRHEKGESAHEFNFTNISVNGNNSLNLLGRFEELEQLDGKWVIYGISLGNEGIHDAENKDSIYNQFSNNLKLLIRKAEELGKEVIIINNYTRGDFTSEDYEQVKKMDGEIARWPVESINVLGVIDDGRGRWAEGYQNGEDIYHPNQAGHTEFFRAIPPSLFDALMEGKHTAQSRSEGKFYELPAGEYITLEPGEGLHSFTFALSLEISEALDEGFQIAEITTSDGGKLKIIREGGEIVAILPDSQQLRITSAGEKQEIVINQNYARGNVELEVNGATTELKNIKPVSPATFIIGNKKEGLKIGEIMLYRGALWESPFTNDGALLKSSLEVYASMDEPAENKAASMVKIGRTREGGER